MTHGRRREWQCLHVTVDDASRVAYAELLPDESEASAVLFLDNAVTSLESLVIRVLAVMTDNACSYTHRRVGARAAWPAPPADTARHAPHKRQSGALHPDSAPRIGLR